MQKKVVLSANRIKIETPHRLLNKWNLPASNDGQLPRNPSICHQPLPAVSRRGLEVLDLSTVKKKMTTHNHRWNSFSSKPLIFVSSSLRTCSEGCRCHRKHAPDVYACANRYINHMYIQTQAEKMHRNGAEIFKSKFNWNNMKMGY